MESVPITTKRYKFESYFVKLYSIQCHISGFLRVFRFPQPRYKPITNMGWVRARLCKLQKGCSRLATASDKVYQLLVHGRWFSPGTPVSSPTKTGHHNIIEILLKAVIKIIDQPYQAANFKSLNCNNKKNTHPSKSTHPSTPPHTPYPTLSLPFRLIF